MSRIDLPKIYNPANQSKQELIDNFVVRLETFQDIFNDIKTSKMKHPEQHYIIQGVRGQGKTTLLLRLAYEIQNDKELNKWLIPIIFSEEQYSVRKLFKLWELTAEYLKSCKGFENLYDEMQKLENDDDYEIKCFQFLESSLKKSKKKIILFIDNIDAMFAKFDKKEHHRLREVLIESAELRIIGASSVSLEFHYDYGKPFFEFFRMPKLKSLSLEETKKLLLRLGEYYKRERVKKIVKEQKGRIESLRRITGGVIRTLVILFGIFVDDEEGNAFIDLENILEDVTPLYKHRMDKLSPQHQEIVDFIALSWDAVSTKEIAAKVKEKSKAVSSQLKVLVKNNIIEQQGTKTKNYLYRLSERFFNIWYLMRHGGKKEENKVKWLVEFLQEWCDDKTLELRATKHLEAIQKGNIYEKQVLYMTEALARTSISYELQDKLINETRTFLIKIDKDLLEELSESDLSLWNKAVEYYDKREFERALQSFLKIKNKNEVILYNIAQTYREGFKDFKKAEKYYLKAIEKEHAGAMNNLALLYKTEFKDFKKAEKYYMMAVEKEDAGAMFNLALLYETEFKDLKKAEKYYLMAVEKEDAGAMFNLALLYETEFKDLKKAEKYYLRAIEKEHAGAMFHLALLYDTEFKDFKRAEKYYLMAIEKGNADAMNNLARLYYFEFKDVEKAKKYCLMAINKANTKAMLGLALIYQTEFKDFKKAEKYYLMAIEKEDAGAMNNLANLYRTEFKDFKKAEKYYLMAVEKEDAEAMYNLALLYKTELKDFKKAEKYYLMAVEKEHAGAMYNLALLYETEFKDFKKAEKYYLMAVEKEHAGAMNNLALLYQTELKDFKKAEKYYLLAIEKECFESLNNLALLYETEFKDFKKAEKYYLMAAKHKHKGAWNGLAWMYFENILDKVKSLEYAKKGYKIEKSIYITHTYAIILLWNNKIEEALKISKDFMENKETYEKFPKDIRQFLMLLIAKKQYHSTLKIFNENQFQLKDRFKPLYYALMYFLQKEYPNEYIKMGKELKQTVDEIIEEINKMAEDYK